MQNSLISLFVLTDDKGITMASDHKNDLIE